MTTCNVFPVINMAATGRVIEQRRKAAGLTVKDVQAYFGFEYPQAVYKWQHGECLPSVDNLLALSRLLRVPMEDLLVYEDQEVPLVFGQVSAVPALGAAVYVFRKAEAPGRRGPEASACGCISFCRLLCE